MSEEEVFNVDPNVRKFLSKASVLLIDSAATCRDVISKCLIEMGSEASNIVSISCLKKAPHIVKEMKPHIIVSEYQIHDNFGLNLISVIEEHYKNPENRIFILLTSTANEVSVAEAAEEDVDAYVVKPFIKKKAIQYLHDAIKSKIKPTDYMLKIRAGKKLFDKNELTSAKMQFMEALEHSSQPSLAFYYMGETEAKSGSFDAAIADFDLGLGHNPIHYKCLVGKFESLDAQKKVKDAYSVVQQITKNYPVTPQRLGRMFYLAVYTHNFTDVERYFDLYTALDRKPPELKKIVSAGMLACAKFVLKQGDKDRAHVLFENAVLASGRNLVMIENIVDHLLGAKLSKLADEILALVPNENRSDPEYRQMDFRIMARQQPAEKVIPIGKKLVDDGVANQHVFEVMVKLLHKGGHERFAENIIGAAIAKFPEMRETLKPYMAA